jgi:uncharacterized protein with HEPN domain
MLPRSAKYLEDIKQTGQTVRDGRITDFRRIIGFRNVLIHGYSIVNHERVWSTIMDDLPKLLAEVEALLGRT